MSLDHSRKLIYDIASQREADAYEQEMMKDPEWRANMERAEQEATKWDALSQEKGIIQPEAPQPENEMER